MTEHAPALDRARTERTALKVASERALLNWQDSVLAGLSSLADLAGCTGPGKVVVLYGTLALAADASCECDEREELMSAAFASANGRTELSPTDGPRWLWAETVAAWDELRSVLIQTYTTDVPVSLVLDLDGDLVAGYEPFYCPELGLEADLLLELRTATDLDVDPLVALLAEESTEFSPDVHLSDLLERYDLALPSEPAHAPGECELDQFDGFEGFDGSSDDDGPTPSPGHGL